MGQIVGTLNGNGFPQQATIQRSAQLLLGGQRIAKHQFVALVREAEMHKTFSKNKTAPAGRRDKRNNP